MRRAAALLLVASCTGLQEAAGVLLADEHALLTAPRKEPSGLDFRKRVCDRLLHAPRRHQPCVLLESPSLQIPKASPFLEGRLRGIWSSPTLTVAWVLPLSVIPAVASPTLPPARLPARVRLCPRCTSISDGCPSSWLALFSALS